MNILEALHWRYAVKKFDPAGEISDADMRTIEEALVLTPSAYGLQPWIAIVVSEPSLKQRLVPASWNQPQPGECARVVVFAARRVINAAYVDLMIAQTGRNAAYREMVVNDVLGGPRGVDALAWSTHQAYIALGNLLTTTALLGVDACPMEGIDRQRYDELLDLGGEYTTVVAVALGRRHRDDRYANQKRARLSHGHLIRNL